MNKALVGIITMPHGISDTETLLWFNTWTRAFAKGMNDYTVVYEIIFYESKHINETLKFLLSRNIGWKMLSGNELLNPSGNVVKIIHDAESGEMLKEFRNE